MIARLAVKVQEAALMAIPSGGTGTAPPGMDAKGTTFLSWVVWFALIACVLGFIVSCARLAISKRHGNDFDAGGILIPILCAAGIAGATTIITAAL